MFYVFDMTTGQEITGSEQDNKGYSFTELPTTRVEPGLQLISEQNVAEQEKPMPVDLLQVDVNGFLKLMDRKV